MMQPTADKDMEVVNRYAGESEKFQHIYGKHSKRREQVNCGRGNVYGDNGYEFFRIYK